MKKLVKLVFLLIIAYPIIGIAVSSCESESDCSIDGRPMLRATLHRMEAGVMMKDTLDSLTITAFKTDSVILNNQKNVTQVYLPLRYTEETTTLVLHYSKKTTDTITINHYNNPKFVSMDCGYEVKQTVHNLRFTTHRLDSVYLSNDTPMSYNLNETSTDGPKNLELFYR